MRGFLADHLQQRDAGVPGQGQALRLLGPVAGACSRELVLHALRHYKLRPCWGCIERASRRAAASIGPPESLPDLGLAPCDWVAPLCTAFGLAPQPQSQFGASLEQQLCLSAATNMPIAAAPQTRYMLGDNGAHSYVVGFGKLSPTYVQSMGASCPGTPSHPLVSHPRLLLLKTCNSFPLLEAALCAVRPM